MVQYDSSKTDSGARRESPVRAPALCPCITCAALEAAAWSQLQAQRAKAAAAGRALPAVSRGTFRSGLGGPCPGCDGTGGLGECYACEGYGLKGAFGRCGECDGTGCAETCGRCLGSGDLEYRRCDACGHMAERRELEPNSQLAAELGVSGLAYECEGCHPCAGCEASVHFEVMDEAGYCLGCQERRREPAAVERLLPAPRAPRALLPERAAAFVRDERGLEVVERAILTGLIIGLLAVVIWIGMWAVRKIGVLESDLSGQPTVVRERGAH